MVYKKVMIIKGYLLTPKKTMELLHYIGRKFNKPEYLQANYLDPHSLSDLNHELNDFISRFNFIKLYGPRCCSGVKDYIIGFEVRSYSRIFVKCTSHCDEYTCCDKCIGLTSNGYYDVDNILQNYVQLDDDHVCKWCYDDTKENISESNMLCEKCSKWDKKGRHLFSEFLDSRIKDWFDDKECHYYYLLDDCLSCT